MRRARQQIKCAICADALKATPADCDDLPTGLVRLRDFGGLIFPSSSTFRVLRTAESVYRQMTSSNSGHPPPTKNLEVGKGQKGSF